MYPLLQVPGDVGGILMDPASTINWFAAVGVILGVAFVIRLIYELFFQSEDSKKEEWQRRHNGQPFSGWKDRNRKW